MQRLNSIEASSRAKINFLEQLYRFHQQQGNTRVSVPTINNKPMDLWLLRKKVQELGGYDAVRRLICGTEKFTHSLNSSLLFSLRRRSQRGRNGPISAVSWATAVSPASPRKLKIHIPVSFSRTSTGANMCAHRHSLLSLRHRVVTRNCAPIRICRSARGLQAVLLESLTTMKV